MEEVVDWLKYFRSISKQCPWSYKAYKHGLIDIVQYTGEHLPLGNFNARVYVVNSPDETVECLADSHDRIDDECEWLFSYPGYGEYATPVPVLIQQHRGTLESLRAKLDEAKTDQDNQE